MFARARNWLASLGLRQARRVVVFVVGMTVLVLGVALLVLPGPAFLVIPAGLAILGLEFKWARRWLRKGRSLLQSKARPAPSRAPRRPAALAATSSRREPS
jgi:uncharacterized protein (TIGR02611 family)